MEHWQIIINLVGGTALTALGWFCRQIWDSIQTLKNEVHAIEVDLPRNYVRQDQIESKLDKIDARFDRLDQNISKLFDRIESTSHK